MIESFIVELYGQTTYNMLAMLFRLYPIWLPVITGVIFWEMWVRYVRYIFFIKTEMTLIEIKIPREVLKSPAAMEMALLSLHQTGGEGTVYDRYWSGKVRAWFSLEIVSIDGEVKFYVWLRKNMRDIVESQFYSQYPNIEINEVLDYAKPAAYKPEENDMWAAHYIFTKPDAYPIKTYIDYGLDKDPKEELKHDPLTSLIEFLGNIKKGEQIWLQYIVRAHKNEKQQKGLFVKKSDWRKAAEKEIAKIHEKVKKEMRTRPSPGELEQIYGIERSIGKYAYDVGIRVIYYVPEKSKRNQTTITGLRGLMRPFSSNNLNGFKPDKTTDFDYPWEDFQDLRLNRMKRRMLDAYKRRSFFFYPYKYKNLVMTNEELATMYHFPGQVAATPGLPRIPSKRAQAPSNLPI
jgi:hypothetical protein